MHFDYPWIVANISERDNSRFNRDCKSQRTSREIRDGSQKLKTIVVSFQKFRYQSLPSDSVIFKS